MTPSTGTEDGRIAWSPMTDSVRPAQPEGAEPRVVVALATYGRPDCLRLILPLLAVQAASLTPPAAVLVVDNNPRGDARDLVYELGNGEFKYHHEPEPGISAARNRALDESSEFDLLVFIDDDETPGQDWLRTLVDCWIEAPVAAVTGPVVPLFEGTLDPWVDGTGVFSRRVLATGAQLRGAASNNLLLNLHVMREGGYRFDERFGLSGGSDSMLTYSMVADGHQIRWCDEAEVVDIIPASRMTRTWVIRRTIRTSNGWTRARLLLKPAGYSRMMARLDLAVRASKRVGCGAAIGASGVFRRNILNSARGSTQLASGLGMMLAVCGFTWHEYSRKANTASSD
jgi:succinoglycan biosynthesis protein ExoM